ncbi:proteoglycan 4-like isoform X1 [Ochotona princeps]|uniref:proteoglycan 4-like isoform X1 n=1 Tax=Ochotona princeps TaxID=9978 RepID=UPI0027148E30|nr:proteoglycan 4-like isoform X1 [Ochotona princeps]
MASTHKGAVFQMVKTNKLGSKVEVSTHKGAEVHSSSPQRVQGYPPTHSQRSTAISSSPPPHRRPEAAHPIPPKAAPSYPRSFSPEAGPGYSSAHISRGTESRPRTDAFRHYSPHRKTQQVQTATSHTVSTHRNVSPPREDAARRGSENKPMRDITQRSSLTPDVKSSRRLSFLDQKDNFRTHNFQEEDPPSKVQNPQGVRVPRRVSIQPKDEAVQTDPIQRTTKSPSRLDHGSSRLTTERWATLKKTLVREPEMDLYSSVLSATKSLHKNINLDSSLKLSVLRNVDGRQGVPSCAEPESLCKHSVYTEIKPSKLSTISQVESNMKSPIQEDTDVSVKVPISPGQSVPATHYAKARSMSESLPRPPLFATAEPSQGLTEMNHMSPGPTARYQEPSQKSPHSAELELTPRPLPPRSLPRYGPESSWWALLNPEVETSQSRPITPDFEPKTSPPLDPFMSLLEMDSSPLCEDLMFQREKASPSLPLPKEPPDQTPMKEVPKTPKHTWKQPIQRCF